MVFYVVACEESYIINEEKDICQTGCNLMAKEQEVLYFYQLSKALKQS